MQTRHFMQTVDHADGGAANVPKALIHKMIESIAEIAEPPSPGLYSDLPKGFPEGRCIRQ